MKNLRIANISFALIVLFSLSCQKKQEGSTTNNEPSIAVELKGIKKWFSAWEMVSKEVYLLDTLSRVDFVFFDDTFVYSTSKTTVNNDSLIQGPNLLNKKLAWRKKSHNGSITLPDGQAIPVGLMSFAAPLENNTAKSFFVMPLPDFWKEAGVESKELGLDNLITCVFLHEFSHTQQMQNFGASITQFENTYQFEYEFSDDIVQDYFEQNSDYTSKFRAEVDLLYQAANSSVSAERDSLAKAALAMYEERQDNYFVDNLEMLSKIDDFFLSMEGVGQYSMYAWLTHPSGGDMNRELAEKGIRRGGKWWSQEEGFALFLVLEKYLAPKNWTNKMFGYNTGSVIELIKNELE